MVCVPHIQRQFEISEFETAGGSIIQYFLLRMKIIHVEKKYASLSIILRSTFKLFRSTEAKFVTEKNSSYPVRSASRFYSWATLVSSLY
jgi:hypothetical protein